MTTAVQGPEQNAKAEGASMGFFWLSLFYLVYWARPEDWISVLGYIPLAKIAIIGTFLALIVGAGKGTRRFRDLPRESYYLLAIIVLLVVSALLSPVWRGGAMTFTLGFSKVYWVWIATFLLVTNVKRLRRIIFIQAASAPIVCLLAIIKGHSRARLEGAGGGFYSNPNDLAFAIVLSLPLCLMFLLKAKSTFRKLLWVSGMLVMTLALFMTASRGGFVMLVFAGATCLWHFGVKERRYYLIAISALVTLILVGAAGGLLKDRFFSSFDDTLDTRQERVASASVQAREALMVRAVEGIEHYPILGLGAGNFPIYSGSWQEVHMTYLGIAVEGGIPTLILYLLFYARGFGNLRQVLRRRDLSPDLQLYARALQASLVGFVVGALFSPEGYQFLSYFAVAYTAVLIACVRESDSAKSAAQAPVPQVTAPAYVRVDRVPVNT